jgi:Zn-dependent M28 family amino/carboxypeptidase
MISVRSVRRACRAVTVVTVAVSATVAVAACGGVADMDEDGVPDAAMADPAREAIDSAGLMRHIQVLAHDSLEGRAPGGAGEERTVRYLEAQFKALGLEPGNPDGTYIQNVSLVGITSRPEGTLVRGPTSRRLAFPRDYVAGTRYPKPEVTLENSELVFVGYGVTAPEFDWDDFKDVDVSGKTVVMLINDPPVPVAGDSALDPAVFKGNAMSYYGRWTYKFEEASRRGAAGALIVHETGPAGYPYLTVINSWGRENFDVNTPGGPAGRVQVEGWLALDAARSVFQEAGLDFDQLKAAAATRDFRPVPLGTTANIRVTTQVREVQSRNVVAKLEGADKVRRDEWVVYTAHWDHLGMDSLHGGDPVFNGALDNASGTATLLEIAGAFVKLPIRTPRSLLFVALTAEEQGLLGAKWYAEHPLYPLEKTVANINMDGFNQWGRTKDITVVGLGNSTLDDVLRAAAARDGRVLAPDPEPEKGYFFRSDHFEFAKKGVPALYINAGSDYVDKPAGYGKQKRDEYIANDYHKPSDEVKPDWDLSGAVEDARALLEVGWRVSYMNTWPTWAPGAEFKAARDAALAKVPR